MEAGAVLEMTAQSDHGANGATSADADAALRELLVAIEHHARGATDIDDLRAAVEEFSANARDEKRPPEQFLVALKEALERLPVRALDPPSVQTGIKERIVSLAIRTYFGEATTARRAALRPFRGLLRAVGGPDHDQPARPSRCRCQKLPRDRRRAAVDLDAIDLARRDVVDVEGRWCSRTPCHRTRLAVGTSLP